jgi:hypothetical protein
MARHNDTPEFDVRDLDISARLERAERLRRGETARVVRAVPSRASNLARRARARIAELRRALTTSLRAGS